MKFSMNGFRKQLSYDTEALRDIVHAVVHDHFYDKEELIELMNQLITHSNVVNCVYHKNDPEFLDLSELEIEHLHIED